MPVGPVPVVVKTELGRVALPLRVLPEKVGDEDRLVSETQRVQLAVRVFFQRLKPGDIELIAVVSVIAEKPDSQIGVAEDEAAEIADERLHARSDRSRIEVRAVMACASAPAKEAEHSGSVAKTDLAEEGLQRDVRVGPRIAPGGINIDDATSLGAQVIDV